MKKVILITGCCGQVGSQIYNYLVLHQKAKVIASDIKLSADQFKFYEQINVVDYQSLLGVVRRHKVTEIYHLAAILSSAGEKDIERAWKTNINGLLNVLNICRDEKVSKLFFPSSIAVFGGEIKNKIATQTQVLTPTTMYGVSKAAGENLCNYYFHKFGVDVRSIRYPGIIGPQLNIGGGTTDYAVEIFHSALGSGKFSCFLSADTILPMIYIEDAIKATVNIMNAPAKNIKIRTSYNLAGFSFSPKMISAEIKKIIPEFVMNYTPDYRQHIADSWPRYINDEEAKKDWNWSHSFNLQLMVETIIDEIKSYDYQNSNIA